MLRFVFLFCAISLCTLAATPSGWANPGANQKPSTALAILESRMGNIGEIRGNFTQVQHLAALSQPLQSSGDFYYSPTEGLVWQTLQPIETTLKITPDFALHTQNANGELEKNRAPEILSRLFLGIFSGDTSVLAELFYAEEIHTEKEPRNSGWQLRLIPRTKALADQVASITLGGDRLIETVYFIQGNGDKREISLSATTLRRGEQAVQDPTP